MLQFQQIWQIQNLLRKVQYFHNIIFQEEIILDCIFFRAKETVAFNAFFFLHFGDTLCLFL